MSSKALLLKELPAFRCLASYAGPEYSRTVDAACAEVEGLVAERNELRAALVEVDRVVARLRLREGR